MSQKAITDELNKVDTQGINLVCNSLGTHVANTGVSSVLFQYTLLEEIELNVDYTFTLYGTGAFRIHIGLPNDRGWNDPYSGRFVIPESKIFSFTGRLTSWNMGDEQTKKDNLALYSQSINATINKIKVERGNVIHPIWSPSPLDIRVSDDILILL